MKLLQITLALTITFLGLGGCSSSAPKMTGFLSDYGNLVKVSETSYRYVGIGGTLAGYDRFIIEPVTVYNHGDNAATPSPELDELAVYFRGAIISAISDSYAVVSTPGPRTARVRIALTDVKKSKWYLSLHPVSKLTGSATGQATMEGEVLDAVTGHQIVAIVESQRGDQFELDVFSEYDDARDVVDDWANRFRKSLDSAHGN